jgi:hypothetical protein
MNKNLMVLLIVVVIIGGGYFLWNMMAGGGYFAGDIPEYRAPEDMAGAQAPSPTQEMPGGAEGIATPGIGGGMPPAAAGAGRDITGAGTPVTPTPGGDGVTPEAGEAPSEPETPLTQEEKRDELAAFEQIDSNDIIRARLDEAIENETPVIPEEDLPYPDTGRTDPLMIVTSAVPEELRPPRSGETDYDSILEYIIKFYGTAILDSIEIEVWSVMQIGLVELVNMSINGRLITMSEGSSYDMSMGYQETLRISVASASSSLVTVGLTYSTPYGSVSKSKTYIPKD